jgi:hypothetical protein
MRSERSGSRLRGDTPFLTSRDDYHLRAVAHAGELKWSPRRSTSEQANELQALAVRRKGMSERDA